MKFINVIDLDKTLIPFDSFSKLLKTEIFKGNIRIIILTVFRIIRSINSTKFKKLVIESLKKKYDGTYFEKYAKMLYDNIDNEVFAIINNETDDLTYNVLVSASPDEYVRVFIKLIGWYGKGSYFINSNKNCFVELYGEEKIKWVKQNYPQNDYIYNFAISDSMSDKQLLSLFKKQVIWTSQ